MFVFLEKNDNHYEIDLPVPLLYTMVVIGDVFLFCYDKPNLNHVLTGNVYVIAGSVNRV